MSLQGLDAYVLPAGTITADDLPGIKTVIRQVLAKISESSKSAGKRADDQTIKSCLLTFRDWLGGQGCVKQVSTTYKIEDTDTYADSIYLTFPGQLPLDIMFNMGGDDQKPYRLMIFVSSFDLLNFGSLVENTTLGGVAFPPSWPKDPWSYWEKNTSIFPWPYSEKNTSKS